ncbi:hypothetical protein Poly30_03150 [Planctomycetes bacterium Poly30]|uniref:YdhG-like domain-containing protein n=1 Tax=Saltatorellus ferox TaxID=2528018 RepID=A0A518EL97_9BACT|nr:hypothetical protein Poly30_03150 [Planctomycetes bacterium Poly30]
MQSQAATVKEYLASLDPDRRKAIEAVRKVIKANLDPKIKEVMSYGMIGYCIPKSVYPPGYHCSPEQPLPFMNVASQKNHMAVYLFMIYGNEGEVSWFETEWKKTGKKLDMGKACLRFKKLEDVALDVLGEAVRRMPADKFIAQYEAVLARGSAGKKKAATKKKATKKKAAKKKAIKKAVKKAPARKKSAKKTATREKPS